MPYIDRTLRPYRDYDEKNVINIAAITGTDLPVNKGSLVKLVRGLQTDQDPTEMLGSFGTFTVSNTVSQRYGVTPKIQVTQTGDNPFGMTLFDIREVDENGEILKYHPHKAAEMEACLSGWSVPIVTRGTFVYSGAETTGTITPGQSAYASANGLVSVNAGSGNVKIGKFMGPTGADGSVFFWLNIQN